MGIKHLFKKPVVADKVVTSQDVVDHLTELNDQAYKQILKIVNIYREADKKVAKITASNQADVTLADVEIPFLEAPLKQSKPKVKQNGKA